MLRHQRNQGNRSKKMPRAMSTNQTDRVMRGCANRILHGGEFATWLGVRPAIEACGFLQNFHSRIIRIPKARVGGAPKSIPRLDHGRAESRTWNCSYMPRAAARRFRLTPTSPICSWWFAFMLP